MKKLRSRVTTDWLDRAPHGAFMRAMGLNDADIAKPMIGVVSQKGEICDQGMGEKVALITDGRFSGATRGMHRLCLAGGFRRRAAGAGAQR